jgi:hypothetical protein
MQLFLIVTIYNSSLALVNYLKFKVKLTTDVAVQCKHMGNLEASSDFHQGVEITQEEHIGYNRSNSVMYMLPGFETGMVVVKTKTQSKS